MQRITELEWQQALWDGWLIDWSQRIHLWTIPLAVTRSVVVDCETAAVQASALHRTEDADAEVWVWDVTTAALRTKADAPNSEWEFEATIGYGRPRRFLCHASTTRAVVGYENEMKRRRR